jgi:alginate O-acetyltransferase complex protein AlgJ
MKKDKYKFLCFLTVACIVIGMLPAINLYKLSKDYDFKKLFNTDRVEKYVNYSFYKLFNISLESNSVVVGDDGFLFLGNRHANVLHKSQGLFDFNKADVAIWTDKLKSIQQWYESRGIQFVLVIAPNKHTVYNNKMARWSRHNSSNRTVTDEIVDIAKTKEINLLDLRSILIKSKTQYDDLLYLRTDTHWNGLGASIAYEETIKYLNHRYNESYQTPVYSYRKVDDGGKDLARFLKIISILPKNHETSIWFDFDKQYDVCLGDINKKTHDLEECKSKGNPSFSSNGHPQYTINGESINNVDLLMLSDSFGKHNSQLYTPSFENIWKLHYGSINGGKLANFVNKHKPNIVIYQAVERELYNQGIVTSLPEIQEVEPATLLSKNKLVFDLNSPSFTFFKNERVSFKNNSVTVTHSDPIIILNDTKVSSKIVGLKYKVDSPVATSFQLFYKNDKSESYSEPRSYRVSLNKGINSINLLIPAKYINNQLRVDLVSSIGKYKIEEFSIYEIDEYRGI